jgi:acyl-CoA hydrolase/GNAT superfamily N-acetyltransferase
MSALDEIRRKHPEKFAPEDRIFSRIHRGDHIFIATGCAEPQHLVRALVQYVESNPKAIFDAEVFHVWTLGVAPYADAKFRSNFRHNSFFVGTHTRAAVNEGLADYTPVFLSQVPGLMTRRLVPVDVALVQTSEPDESGFMSLGVSVDITRAAAEQARLVIAQVNPRMPRVHGDAFLHVKDVHFLVPFEEPLLEYETEVSGEIAGRIGNYVARIVEDGDTIQVGYGSVPNAIVANLGGKRHLGIHTELLSDGLIDLMRSGVADNSRKTLNRGKAVATFCMGHRASYEFLDDNPAVEFKAVDYTNSPLVIARHDRMTAINSALEIDLTGQASAESLGGLFYSGIGGHADFMRGAVLARGGKTILTLPSTAENESVSRIAPVLKPGAGVTLNRGDVHYVVTEYGIAYLHGKNIRERAMELIAVAHPKFRPWLVEEAKARRLVFGDQAFLAGKSGEYPEEMEAWRTARGGVEVLLRPVKIHDEPLLKDFFYSLSDQSLYRRFMSVRKDMPHERLQDFVVIDYTREMVILAVIPRGATEELVGLGQFSIHEQSHTAEVAFVVRDAWQGKGIGRALLDHLTLLAKKKGLYGFTAEVLIENRPMLSLFEKMGFDIRKSVEEGTWELAMTFVT